MLILSLGVMIILHWGGNNYDSYCIKRGPWNITDPVRQTRGQTQTTPFVNAAGCRWIASLAIVLFGMIVLFRPHQNDIDLILLMASLPKAMMTHSISPPTLQCSLSIGDKSSHKGTSISAEYASTC